ncbi:GTP-binding protein EngB [Halorhodospira halochloris]|uniref:Probable GTP-binding protein EngB n=1 Tax=Halorhodospira halochloris TaxID=1052 RepID=A0A0X8X7Z7_HALHR|nr:ribosome biogenesis GTP-binding protein YihA/YsxC [Halorhodospira halochloris]BAU56643.2 GTP-binding protein EngB [Halorhodospira halochloris]
MDNQIISKLYRGARFRLSAPTPDDLCPDTGAEVAFAGRSNVGKSSVINTLTGQRKLARTSGTPGRTQAINVFDLDEQRRLVDLPGYGYAKVPASVKRRWEQALPAYFQYRRSLCGVVIIMDIRHAPTDLDMQMIDWSRSAHIRVHGLLTKSDKLKHGAAKARQEETIRELSRNNLTITSIQRFSAPKGEGVDELAKTLDGWLELGNF